MNHNLVARVFPRLRQLGCFCIEFSLALIGNFLPPDWPLLLFWFEFYDTRLKSALWGKKTALTLVYRCVMVLYVRAIETAVIGAVD